VLDYARKAGMAFDRPARCGVHLVEGMADDQAALVLKVHHSLTDGIGGIQMAQHVVDLGEEPTDLGPMPDLPEADDLPLGPAGPLLEALGYDLSHLVQTGIDRLRVLPRDTVRALRDPVGSIGAPSPRPLDRPLRPPDHRHARR
jgi:hypothetical protein